ncbi:murein biosynthesis integral membrane protein MurJ [Candidatus Oscillochloris fontis]|uniref:murein biosynthesis integral membrane protein MurJ n=1 Tax=Candidatus Oscillochloris fontis TaxID=2496868 RepID=UPI00101B821A|nr:murein biosynthesis integral membrane protein MurJ [Candidatus Oscillochloris fontis]
MQLVSLFRRARSGALGNSLIVMGGFVLSRITGVLRDVIASYFFGTSPEMTAYRSAFQIVDLLYLVIIGGALGSSFIPVFIQVWEQDGEERAWRLAGAVLSWALLILTVASGLIFLAAPWLVQVIYGGQGFEPATLELTTQLARLFLFSPLLLGLGGLAMAALNARDRFTAPALAPTIYNLGIMLGALAAPWLGIWGMGWGVVIGALGYLLVQLPALRGMGMRLYLNLGRQMAEVGTVAHQMGPRVLGQAAAHISIVATSALAARLVDGDAKVAGLIYAYQLMLLPFGVFSLSLSQVAFPRLARLVAEGRYGELAADVRRTLGTILWLTLPASVALLVLGMPTARVLFERGAFDTLSLHYTTQALIGYAAALPAFAASEILIRSFYALQRTWTPVLVGLLQVGLNIGLGAWLLTRGGDIGALALAFSLANNIEALLLFGLLGIAIPGMWRDVSMWRRLAGAGGATLLLAGFLLLARSLSMGFLPALALEHPYIWQREILPLTLWLGLVAGVGAGGYYGISRVLRITHLG